MRVLGKELGADVVVENGHGLAPLHLAARDGHIEAIRVLVRELGVDVDSEDSNNMTPLHYAAEYGHRGCLVRSSALMLVLRVVVVSLLSTSPPPMATMW